MKNHKENRAKYSCKILGQSLPMQPAKNQKIHVFRFLLPGIHFSYIDLIQANAQSSKNTDQLIFTPTTWFFDKYHQSKHIHTTIAQFQITNRSQTTLPKYVAHVTLHNAHILQLFSQKTNACLVSCNQMLVAYT